MEKSNKMEIKDFLTNLSKGEAKRVSALTNGESDLSLIIHSSQDSYAAISGYNTKPYISLICILNDSGHFCYGDVGQGAFDYGDGVLEEDFVRVIIDSKSSEKKKMFLHHKNSTQTYSIKDSVNNDLVLVYIETRNYAQFCLYDGKLTDKFSEIYVRDAKGKESLRSIAFSITSRTHPDVQVKKLIGDEDNE